jgi:hypothetical protein
MTSPRTRAWGVLACAIAASAGLGCKLDTRGKVGCVTNDDCFSGRTCVSNSCVEASVEASPSAPVACGPDGQCAPSDAGKPMTCYQASSLGGGADFCTEQCDPSQPPTDPTLACVGAGAILHRCHPSPDAGPGADCPDHFSCYRTSLSPLSSSGLCIQMAVCTHDTDCASVPTHPICAATLVDKLAGPTSALLLLDHLNCVQTGCQSNQSSCPSAEGCLDTQYSAIADLCVPTCVSTCPPNFSCGNVTSGVGASRLCIPDVPGARCDGDNCVLGTCQDSGAGFSVCSMDCTSDANCALWNTGTDIFYCVDGGSSSHCVTPRPFDGANCALDSDCLASRHEFCAHTDRNGVPSSRGECRVPCDDGGACDPQGGLPHGCLGALGGCYPGVVGIPCVDGSECLRPLSCEVVPSEADGGSAQICSTPCAVDGGGDEDPDPQCGAPNIAGYCGAGFCRALREPGQPCSRAAQCNSKLCDTVNLVCLPLPQSTGTP